MNLARFPRIRFAHLPTPLEHMPNLSRALGRPEIWIKRDDCTGMSTGGDQTRKLEYLMAEARDQGADIVLTRARPSPITRARPPHAPRKCASIAAFFFRITPARQITITQPAVMCCSIICTARASALRGQSGHECRTCGNHGQAEKRGPQTLCHTGRGIEYNRRSRLRQCRDRTHRASR